MEAIEAELMKDEAKRDDRGRRLVAEQERERLIAAYRCSGMTQKEFARREGIKYATFVAWLGRDRRSSRSSTESPMLFEQFTLGGAVSARLEVRLPDGVIISGTGPDEVLAVVKALRR